MTSSNRYLIIRASVRVILGFQFLAKRSMLCIFLISLNYFSTGKQNFTCRVSDVEFCVRFYIDTMIFRQQCGKPTTQCLRLEIYSLIVFRVHIISRLFFILSESICVIACSDQKPWCELMKKTNTPREYVENYFVENVFFFKIYKVRKGQLKGYKIEVVRNSIIKNNFPRNLIKQHTIAIRFSRQISVVLQLR